LSARASSNPRPGDKATTQSDGEIQVTECGTLNSEDSRANLEGFAAFAEFDMDRSA
jgi:hypothetical protein